MQPWDSRTVEAIGREILPCLPESIRRELAALPAAVLAQLEEIRLRQGRPLMLVLHDRDHICAHVVSGDDTARALQLMSQSSVYALEEELRQGYLTLRGGHRVGFVGRALVEGGRVRAIKHIAGLNVRVSRELPGAAERILPLLLETTAGARSVCSTLIVGPPRAGKTTLLRDICRQLANGTPQLGLSGLKVGLVDERSEIAGCHQGVPQRDVGLRTDVLDACPKAEGIMLLIRSMSPDVVITDELGRTEDAAAVEEAASAGVAIVASVHGSGLADLGRRPSLRQLMATGVFQRLVFLSRRLGPGTVSAVTDGAGKPLVQLPDRMPRASEVEIGAFSETAR